MIDPHHGWNVSFKPQFLGFLLSLLLLIASYLLVIHHHLPHNLLWMTIFGLAILQGILQLILFMHLGLESKPHWNTITFFFMVIVIFIIVGGSLWIMSNLDYNLMPPMDMPTH